MIIDEAALWRAVGNPVIHLAQLELLLVIIHLYPKVTVRIIPYSADAYTDVQGSFAIMDFPWSHDPGVVYLEGHGDSQILEDKSSDWQKPSQRRSL